MRRRTRQRGSQRARSVSPPPPVVQSRLPAPFAAKEHQQEDTRKGLVSGRIALELESHGAGGCRSPLASLPPGSLRA